MPNRILREGILDSDPVNGLTPEAEVFYRRLMSVVDDYGRFDGRAAVLRSRLYPLQLEKVREAGVERWIAECVKVRLIRLYESNGKPYLTFLKLGAPRAKASKWPAPPEDRPEEQPPAGETPGSLPNPPQGGGGNCVPTQADARTCAQTRASVPYSISDAHTNSGTRRPHSRARPHEIPESFKTFWAAYPRRVDKADAVNAWEKLGPDEELVGVILAALERHKATSQWQRGADYIPHASTWLNHRRWEDEIADPVRPKGKTTAEVLRQRGQGQESPP